MHAAGPTLFAAGMALAIVAGAAHAEITAERLGQHVRYLADDAREGRGPGTAGADSAAAYVVRELRAAGATPLFDGDYRQPFTHGDHTLTNVGAIVPGEPGEQYVILAAHYDHLGMDPEDGSLVYNGADDNASGVAALLEIARELLEGPAPRRSVVLLAFDGEELGLSGSQHYVASPALPLEGCAAMVNLDSIGRLRDDRLVVFGTGTADVFEETLEGLNRAHGFDLARNTEGVGAGDHETFFARGIPVLHLFTDAHLDYHQPTDTADRISLDGLERIASFTLDLVSYLSDDALTITFVPAGAEKIAARTEDTGRRTVTLGTIPDFARESGGVRVSGVVPGSPAEQSGIAVDDVIVAIDGTNVDNLYDYSAILKSHSPGDEIAISIVRGGERMEVRATLVPRR